MLTTHPCPPTDHTPLQGCINFHVDVSPIQTTPTTAQEMATTQQASMKIPNNKPKAVCYHHSTRVHCPPMTKQTASQHHNPPPTTPIAHRPCCERDRGSWVALAFLSIAGTNASRLLQAIATAWDIARQMCRPFRGSATQQLWEINTYSHSKQPRTWVG
jgi:hypothetical protein